MTFLAHSKRELKLFLLGGLLGALIFLLCFGTSTLDFSNDTFLRGGYIEKDIQQHYAGWLFYRRDSIGWPLCVTTEINAPQGVSVAYTDSIPLFAAIFRQIAPEWGDTFQYFGLFTLLCFVLQGGFGALLCGLFAQGTLLPLLGDLLFVTSPVLFDRVFRHTSLGAQFFILAALYYYFKSRREGRYRYAGLFLLNMLVIGIHAYYLPMVYAITLAMLINHALKSRDVLGPALYLGANLVSTALFGGCLGFLYGTATSGGQALYGYFGMNLNALWNPVSVSGTHFSRFLPAQNMVNGNYDAFAYLGLGVLLALPAACVALRKTVLHHLPLCAVCAILTVFAVSHVVTANGATLFTLPLPERLIQFFSIFRSGGRLFWPVYYLLMLTAFVGLCRLKGRWPLPLAVLLAAVQVWDVSAGMQERSAAMKAAQTQNAFPSALQSDFWEAAESYRHILSVEGLQDDALHLALYAADNGMSTNDPFAARYDAAALEDQRSMLKEELASGTLRQDCLYLFEEEGAFLQSVDAVKDQAWCGRVTSEDGVNCWYVIAPGMQDMTFDALCTAFDENYPLRLADYTDALWNRGVLDADRQIICFADSVFAREKLGGAVALCADGREYPILRIDDSDPGWLMVTLEIDDATILWDKELTTK